MDLVSVDLRKWPERGHYQFQARRLGRDQHGTWLHTPSGTVVTRVGHEPWEMPAGFVGLVPVDRWWVVEYYIDHPTISVYVNIGTPPIWNGSTVSQIDLDLDVIRRPDGSVLIIDEDEFDEHRVEFEYPDRLVRGARRAADRAVGLLENSAEPFNGAAAGWIGEVDPMSLKRLSD